MLSPDACTLLTALLSRVPGLEPEEIADFAARWDQSVLLRRGDFLVQPGQVEQRLCFVRSGLLRIYFPITPGEETCVGFGYANSLLCSFPSFATGQPSEYAIQALQQSELLAIGRADFMEFMEQSPAFSRFWRMELEKALVGRMEHEIDLLLPEPAQRLARLRQRSPHIFQLVPRKYLASYLRMTPETLSRLK
ncbi:Crp/Fnr family transcriptional regulator [Hymenobacter negativus]|uniref:Crp/Fnr family transcriptional regulator n=1 Tax=Hymenobacter negativus TaxID=2795026 RepID=A0ABS3QCC1_9BACT|nr:Crp/Fnr family transcriptional regulator [Hymenobacter negativus]MBO2008878.1 Crp/Fnr family transcriptional regulator [Hymenobacter negativus]